MTVAGVNANASRSTAAKFLKCSYFSYFGLSRGLTWHHTPLPCSRAAPTHVARRQHDGTGDERAAASRQQAQAVVEQKVNPCHVRVPCRCKNDDTGESEVVCVWRAAALPAERLLPAVEAACALSHLSSSRASRPPTSSNRGFTLRGVCVCAWGCSSLAASASEGHMRSLCKCCSAAVPPPLRHRTEPTWRSPGPPACPLPLLSRSWRPVSAGGGEEAARARPGGPAAAAAAPHVAPSSTSLTLQRDMELL